MHLDIDNVMHVEIDKQLKTIILEKSNPWNLSKKN